jgi:outer membrane protein assembly factor BamB
VFTLSRWGDAFCFEAGTGKIIWSKNIQKETDLTVPTWGFTGAPFAYEKLLILNAGDAGMALEQATGKIVWKSANKSAGYSTPLPIQRDGKWLTIFANSSAYVAVNPSDGKEAWRVRWLTEYGVNASDPIVSGDMMFIATGYGKGCALFKLGAGEPEQLWKSKVLRTRVNPAVLYENNLYGLDGDTSEKAPLRCLEFATGKELWSQPNVGAGAVSVADGKLILISGAGELIIAPATASGFKPTARGQLFGGNCWTVPVLANGFIYCRNGRGDVAVVDVRSKRK